MTVGVLCAGVGASCLIAAIGNLQLVWAAARARKVPEPGEQMLICVSGRLPGAWGLLRSPYLLAATTNRVIVLKAGPRSPVWSVPYEELERFNVEPGMMPVVGIRGAGIDLVLTGLHPEIATPLAALVGDRSRRA